MVVRAVVKGTFSIVATDVAAGEVGCAVQSRYFSVGSVVPWAEERGKPTDPARLTRDDDLLAAVQLAVDDANQAVSKAESIRKFVVLPHDWTEEGGQLTPSLKLKRSVVTREERDEIASLYLP